MKHKELINLSPEELDKKTDELELELIKLNSQVASGTTPKNPGHIKVLKKTIARIKTIQATHKK